MEEHMRQAKAFVFAAEEDFGITPVELKPVELQLLPLVKVGHLKRSKVM
jgi:hypothetical protein